MSQPTSPRSTPKRKRDEPREQGQSTSPSSNFLLKTVFSFEPPSSSTSTPDDGSSSPRTKVATKLRDLSLESGGGVLCDERLDGDFGQVEGVKAHADSPSKPAIFGFNGATNGEADADDMQTQEDGDIAVRKRHKYWDLATDITPGDHGESSAEVAGPVGIDEHGRLTLDKAVDPAMVRIARAEKFEGLQKSYPSINRLEDSKSRSRRRASTPPLGSFRRKTFPGADIEGPPVIVDPVRAALTWHEDEITVYDAEDKDDDGTGLNGIGFRPTPAIAYQRAQKRKKQLSEYKKREESEARALRNQRRREHLGGGSALDRKHSIVRVHFDIEPETLVTT